LNNLAIALRLRQLRRRSGREDLDQAIAAYEAALAESPAGPERPAFHANLGTALHQRYDVTNDAGDLDRAARALETALALTPADSPDRPMYLNNLSATLAARAERLDKTEDLVRAATMLREGLPLCAESSVHRPGMLVNLGNAASELFDRLGDPRDRADARAAYRSALRGGMVTSPADALAAASNWTEWAARRRAWSEVVEAHRLGERAALRLFRTQVTRADKESWLRDADGLATYGAFARAARADLPGAVMAVELGRGLLFSERLERERAGLQRLQAEREELALRYRAAAARVDQLEGGA
jgi:hypothetical protein